MALLPSREGMDYRRARLRAFFSGILAAVSGHPRQLLAFEKVREKLHLGGPVYRGVKTVPLAKVVGSVDRYRDFDRAFMPTQSHTEDRWRRVNRAWYQDLSLPPIVLYQVGDVYFVVDGHHRVSEARDKGQEFLDAEVREVRARVPLAPDVRPEDLERLEAKVEFLERTQIDRLLTGVDIAPTILGGYDRLIEHLAVHRYFLGLELQHEVLAEDAIRQWYETL
ncbi:MAG: transcriptional regulator, partial [Anaerolineales bacterium]